MKSRSLLLSALICCLTPFAFAQSTVSMSGTFPIPSTNVDELTAQRLYLGSTCTAGLGVYVFLNGGTNLSVCNNGTTVPLGLWTEDAGNSLLYPNTITHNVLVGTDTPSTNSQFEIESANGNAFGITSSVEPVWMNFEAPTTDWSLGVGPSGLFHLAQGNALTPANSVITAMDGAGIGILTSGAAPTQALEVDGNADINSIFIGRGSSIPPAELLIADSTTTSNFLFEGDFGGDMLMRASNISFIETGSGTQVMQIDGGTENVGIGPSTIPPSAKLHVQGSTLVENGTLTVQTNVANDMGRNTPLNGAMIIEDTHGRLGMQGNQIVSNGNANAFFIGSGNGSLNLFSAASNINGTTPQIEINAAGDTSVNGNLSVDNSASGASSLLSLGAFSQIEEDVAGNLTFSNAGNTFIDNSSGDITITSLTDMQLTNSTTSLHLSNSGIGINLATPTDPSHLFWVNGTAAATAWDTTSDKRLKKNIKPLKSALDKILQMRGVSFTWKKDNQKDIGLIAQEVEKVLPDLVSGTDQKSVAYGNMVAVLIEAIKEQQAMIDDLQEQINDLKDNK